MIKSHVPAINVPSRIGISNLNDVASTSKAHLKRGQPMGFAIGIFIIMRNLGLNSKSEKS